MTKETQRQVPRFQLCFLSASLFREVAFCAIDALTEDKMNNSSKKKCLVKNSKKKKWTPACDR